MNRYIFNILLFFFTAVLLFSCRRAAYQIVYPSLNDGRYDSEFPYRNSSEELDRISKSVKKLYCLVEYDRFHFDETQMISKSKLQNINPRKAASQKGFFSESVHGTATIIKNNNNNIVVLTCAHIVDYPDTIYSWFLDENNDKTDILESVSIKKKQNNFIRELPRSGEMEIIFMDSDLDIAFLGNSFPDLSEFTNPVFSYPVGMAKDLEWGSFVYIMGYPAGYQMVTRGIVSNPKLNKKGEFIIDALFNQGISGGIVLAVRDGVPNFELVGIAKSVSAIYKNVIKPVHESHEEMYNPNVPYEGDLFVKVEKDLNYGVTFTISIETIRDAYLTNRNSFTSRGFNLDNFFSRGK
ncbi:MAG: serine protease [Bacteroidales bacterium]|nr:serine protease [Bacteroidales bacterium]